MKVTVIGGGTGSTAVLEGLKRYRDLNLRVIVGMMDDGGSNAVIRDEFGLLPLSDLRKSIIALADEGDNAILRKLFTYRFSTGAKIKGHTMGNLLMVAMTDIMGDELSAIETFKSMFNVRGEIIPVTLDKAKLVAEYTDGTKVVGEHFIDEPEVDKKIKKISLDSKTKILKQAKKTILDSDFVIIGPGDIYTTTLQSLIVPGVSNALQKTKAKVILVTNLMTKMGQTRGMTQKDIVDTVEKYTKRKFDYVIINKGDIPLSALRRYIEDGESVLEDNLHDGGGRKILRKDVVANDIIKQEKGDTLKRSLVRHDSQKLAKVLNRIFTTSDVRRIWKYLVSQYID